MFCNVNDPFDATGDQTALIDENITQTNTILGAANYDVGHLLVWANTGGVAYSGVVCTDTHKAGGFSGSNASITSLYVDYAAHEIGHQFSAQHNFISAECQTSENNYRFEPGEGSSIMSYAGVCGAGYQNMSDPYFHSASIADIKTYMAASGTCGTTSTPAGGVTSDPMANANEDLTIPKNTPFILVGTGHVGGSHNLEQIDGGSAAVSGPPDPNGTITPNFRFRSPTPTVSMSNNLNTASQFFPTLDYLENNPDQSPTWDKLPNVARTMNFRIISRNEQPQWGSTNTDDMVVTVADTGPFKVTFPNMLSDTWNTQGPSRIEWDVAGTDAHCDNVMIYILFNGNYEVFSPGAGTPNDGLYEIPSGLGIPPSSNYRVAVTCRTDAFTNNTLNFARESTFYDVGELFTISATEPTTPQILPLDFLAFDAKRNSSQGVDLDWRTTSEINTSHFEVERSLDGSNFMKIGEVKSVNVFSTINDYAFTDKSAIMSARYYRLKQVDLDGKFEYSKIAYVSSRKENNDLALEVVPNPAKEYIEVIGGNADEYAMKLIGVDGSLIKSQNTASNRIDLDDVPNGIYFLETTVYGKLSTQKIVVQK